MQNKWVKMILDAFLSLLPLLFLYGVVVNVATFYQGITSSWITLFTMMTCSGALLLRVLLQYLFCEQGLDYEKDNCDNDTWNLWLDSGYSCWAISFGM